MERWDSYDGGVRKSDRKCDSPKEVCQLLGRCDGHGKK